MSTSCLTGATRPPTPSGATRAPAPLASTWRGSSSWPCSPTFRGQATSPSRSRIATEPTLRCWRPARSCSPSSRAITNKQGENEGLPGRDGAGAPSGRHPRPGPHAGPRPHNRRRRSRSFPKSLSRSRLPQIVEEAPKPEPKAEPEPPQVAKGPDPGPRALPARTPHRTHPRDPDPTFAAEEARETPSLILEDPRARMESQKGPVELARLGIGSRPDQLVENAIQSMQERGGGPQSVGDGVGAYGGTYSPPSPGNIGQRLGATERPEGSGLPALSATATQLRSAQLVRRHTRERAARHGSADALRCSSRSIAKATCLSS